MERHVNKINVMRGEYREKEYIRRKESSIDNDVVGHEGVGIERVGIERVNSESRY